MPALIVLTAVPDLKSARLIASLLVKRKLAACVSLQKGLRSVYRWKGKVENVQEFLLMIKTKKSRFKSIERMIKSKHPYELPEIIGLRVDGGSKEYLSWLNHSLN